jgi:acetyl-CoA C-acetyltransferase
MIGKSKQIAFVHGLDAVNESDFSMPTSECNLFVTASCHYNTIELQAFDMGSGEMKEVVIVGAARTPIGSFMGTLSSVSAVELGAVVIKEALRRSGVSPEAVDEVIMGNVLQAGQGMGPARQAMVQAGLRVETPAVTVNKICGSGLKSIISGAQAIMAGDAEVVVAGGMENMSKAPYLLKQGRTGYRMGDGAVIDSMTHDGLTCSVRHIGMGTTAENIADRFGITREEQDRFALKSQHRAEQASAESRFQEEIVAVDIRDRKGQVQSIVQDEHPRSGLTIESLTKLKPAFHKEGTVTAGNASGINDGAAAVVLCSHEAAVRNGWTPLARIRSYAYVGVEPSVMGLGPVPAVQKALQRAGLTTADIALAELNEAFAVQALAVIRELGLDESVVNVNGGAIALGHPIGASGTRIVVSLLYEMARRQSRYGLASLCVGGGHGVAAILERM